MILWLFTTLSFFLNLNHTSYRDSAGNCLKFLISSFSYNILAGRKNLFKIYQCKLCHAVIEHPKSCINHSYAYPVRKNRNNLNLKAFSFTPRMVYKLQIPIKLERFFFTSSITNLKNIPFKFNNWITALVVPKLTFLDRVGGIMDLVLVIQHILPLPNHMAEDIDIHESLELYLIEIYLDSQPLVLA